MEMASISSLVAIATRVSLLKAVNTVAVFINTALARFMTANG